MSHSKYLETLLYIIGEDDYEGLGGISIHTLYSIINARMNKNISSASLEKYKQAGTELT